MVALERVCKEYMDGVANFVKVAVLTTRGEKRRSILEIYL